MGITIANASAYADALRKTNFDMSILRLVLWLFWILWTWPYESFWMLPNTIWRDNEQRIVGSASSCGSMCPQALRERRFERQSTNLSGEAERPGTCSGSDYCSAFNSSFSSPSSVSRLSENCLACFDFTNSDDENPSIGISAKPQGSPRLEHQ